MRYILRFTSFGTCILTIYLLLGCAAVPVTVTSDPPGATVYAIRGYGSIIFEPVGITPYIYPDTVFDVNHLKVVWPDGAESRIQSSPWNWSGGSERVVHFEKPKEYRRKNVVTIQSGRLNAPWGPLKVVNYTFDARTQKGSLSVDISDKGFEVRDWVVKNIGKICSNQNIRLEAGKEPTTGGHYKILNESVKSNILTIEFEALF